MLHPSWYERETVQTHAIPAQSRCQCNHTCQFRWFPFVMILLVVLLYVVIITTILLYKLLT